jgi:hypothetical protein
MERPYGAVLFFSILNGSKVPLTGCLEELRLKRKGVVRMLVHCLVLSIRLRHQLYKSDETQYMQLEM